MKMLFLFLIFLISLNLYSQEKFGVVNINTEPSGAFVYIDSELVGRTPIANLRIKTGTYTLKLKNPEIANWLEQDITQKIEIKENDTLNLYITFEKFIKINSNPFSADILIGDSIIGTTPAIFKIKDLVGKNLKIKKKGYNDTEVFVDGKTQKIEINLTPRNGAETELRTESKNKLNIILPIVGIGLASGITSIYLKSKADKLYEQYLKSQEPSKLERVKNYDKAAGLTLLLFEATLIFSIFLLLQN